MATTIDALKVRKALGHKEWLPPATWGPDGWCFVNVEQTKSVIVSVAWMDGVEWIHASVAYLDEQTVPTHADLMLLADVFFPDGYAYQVFSPQLEDTLTMHLYGRVDGEPVLPEFGN